MPAGDLKMKDQSNIRFVWAYIDSLDEDKVLEWLTFHHASLRGDPPGHLEGVSVVRASVKRNLGRVTEYLVAKKIVTEEVLDDLRREVMIPK